MFDFHPAVLNAFIGLLGVVLLVFAWRSVSSLPGAARWSLRAVLAVAILAPFAVLILTPRYEMARTPADADRSSRDLASREETAPVAKPPAVRPPAPEAVAPAPAPPPPLAGQASRPPATAAPRPVEPTAPATSPPASATPDVSSPTRGLDKSGTGEGGGGSDGGQRGFGAPQSASGAKPGEPGASSPTSSERADSSTDLRSMESAPSGSDRSMSTSPPAAAAGEEKEDWTVVPVYYGTDRARVPNDKRVDYGADRGRRLELGRALVSVPKAHEVPQVERPWAITVPYFNYKVYQQAEDPKKHFIIQDIKAMSEPELLKLVKERLAKSARYKDHAFIFIHGYNTSFDFAIYRAAQIAYDIKFDGAPFAYSWPSGGGIASYTYDRESSAQAEPYFTEFLKMVAQKSGAKHVSIIAHSMGNQLLLRVLQDLQRTRPEGVRISQVIFAAPDVDRDSFESIATQIKDFATGGITLYAAANDRALSVSKRFYGGVPRAGDVPTGGPLVMPGIDTIDATAVSMDSLGLHHSGYAESNALLQDIGLLIQTGERPPGKRVPILQKITTPKGNYWRYPGTQ